MISFLHIFICGLFVCHAVLIRNFHRFLTNHLDSVKTTSLVLYLTFYILYILQIKDECDEQVEEVLLLKILASGGKVCVCWTYILLSFEVVSYMCVFCAVGTKERRGKGQGLLGVRNLENLTS